MVQKRPLLHVHVVCGMLLVALGYVAIVTTGIATHRTLRSDMRSMSPRTLRMQRQLNRMLLVEVSLETVPLTHITLINRRGGGVNVIRQMHC